MKNLRFLGFIVGLQIFFAVCSRSSAEGTCSDETGVCIKAITHPLTISEGPHWDIINQVLYFVDIVDQTLWCWNPATSKLTNAYIKNGMLGVAIPAADKKNTFVAGAGLDFIEVTWDPTTNSSDPEIKVLATVDSDRNGTRFNDGKIDPQRRFWGGTMAKDETPGQGSLYRIGPDMKPQAILRNVTISNGLTWSHDNKTFYYIDSPTKQVHVYDYNDDTGDISNMRVLFDFVKNDIPGVPDGMTIDAIGNLWVACYNGGRVICVDALSGNLVRTVTMPVQEVTSVAFGGQNLDTLYVTTARQKLSKKELESQPLAGSVFAVTGLGINGRPMLGFRF